jgi:hypothetical protein
VEETFLTPEEVAALWKLPSVVEGGTSTKGNPTGCAITVVGA